MPKDDSHFYGCLIEDETSHELLHYAEKPESFVSTLINGGIYVLSAEFFENIEIAYKDMEKRQPHYT